MEKGEELPELGGRTPWPGWWEGRRKNVRGKICFRLFQPRVNAPGTSAFRQITGDIVELTFGPAHGANLRRLGRLEGEAAFGAAPRWLTAFLAHDSSFDSGSEFFQTLLPLALPFG
jgi:hypothetical protein